MRDSGGSGGEVLRGPWLIALDLDGTVLCHDASPEFSHVDGVIDERLPPLLQRLAAAGHQIVVATGRSADATLPVVERLGLRPEWVVVANGAVVLRRDPLATRGYRRELVESFDATDVLRRVRRELTGAKFALELASGGVLYTEDMHLDTLPSDARHVEFDELLRGHAATRVVVISPGQPREQFLAQVAAAGLHEVSYFVGHTAWLDIAPEGVTKASALATVAARCGIPAQRWFAAGDGRNDIEMLRWAGHAGVSAAMGQAAPEVCAAATRVTAPVGAGGLVDVLLEVFGE